MFQGTRLKSYLKPVKTDGRHGDVTVIHFQKRGVPYLSLVFAGIEETARLNLRELKRRKMSFA